MMARIFLCHASEDKVQVREVYHRLRAIDGFEPWLDEEDLLPGQQWAREIPLALKASDFILIFLSTNSVVKRGYVQREMKLALDALQEVPEGTIFTIPVLLDACQVPEQFRPYHYAKLFESHGFDRLVRAIQTELVKRAPMKDALPSTWANSIGMEFVLIPAGTFTMGSPDSDTRAFGKEKPAHWVTISQPFYLGKYPVTQAQWEAVMGNNPSEYKGHPKQPVENVSWDDVQAFLRTLTEREGGGDYRLPTEAQWEYACRAGTETARYHPDVDAIAWYLGNSNQPQPVGQKLPNAWGLYDMLGNVGEWCLDGRRDYTTTAVVDPMGPTSAGADRVTRGGCWLNSAYLMRAAYRNWNDPVNCLGGFFGFRCASSGPSK
jgi:formylglycine-generating enzyme required for sulfatase activity